MNWRARWLTGLAGLAWLAACALARAADDSLAQVIRQVKPSVVGIGAYLPTATPPIRFIGTGFVVGDGLTVLSAAHVIQQLQAADRARPDPSANKETIGVLIDLGGSTQFRGAAVVKLDSEHDLVRLRMGGQPLPALPLGDASSVVEGQAMAFTGFPLGMVLGLHHVTHRATISSITPVVMPASMASKLGNKAARQLRQPGYAVFQLDATAYPGSSGSPLYDANSGTVYGIVNMVYIKGLKESAISTPSGITYAIPGQFIGPLMRDP